MQNVHMIWANPYHHLARTTPDHPILYLSPEVL